MLKKRIFAGMSAAAIALSMMSMTSFAEGGRVKLFTNGIEEQNAGVIIPVFTTGGSYWSVEDDEQVAALLTDPNYKISFLDDDDVDSLYFYVSGDAIPSFYSDTADVYDNSIYSDRIIESLMDIYPDADLANATYFDFDNSYRAGSHPTAPVVTYEPMLIKADEGLYTINNARLPYGCASVVAVPPVGTEV
ncbi:MAG: hypothetical protein IJ129_05900, partial [Ruminococcus sp.]|nr:hypothetical protein [Ruminococcus sp.]